jgi:ATP-dependent helicase/nuclease subunit A
MSDPVPVDPVLVDPARSLWVSAHAGAGKTRVLIDRVARLLVAGTKPEQILCLTFTKAAAAEMATRLSQTLGTLALADDETLRKQLAVLHVTAPDAALLTETRRLFARALETPGGLKIQTIHAFCERLLGRFPIEAGVVPGFEVLDERTAAELLAEAQRRVLQDSVDAEGAAALALLARLGDGAGLQSLVLRLRAAQRDVAGEGAPPDLEAAAGAVAGALGLGQGETPEAVTRDFLDKIPIRSIRQAAGILSSSSTKDRERSEGLGVMSAASQSTRGQVLERYVRVFATEKDQPKKDVCTKPIQNAHPEIETTLRAEQTRVLSYVERHKAAIAAERARAALLIGGRILARYEALKRRRAALDYDDLIARSARLFSRSAASWVLYKLDNGIDHILVDEAQDTNPLQWRVIANLADEFFAGETARKGPRSIFAVGDEKQSIFRFQGADPAIFARMEEHFDEKLKGVGARLHSSPLNKSWRSTRPILKLVDAVFEDPALKSQLSSGMVPLTHYCTRDGQAGLVELWPTEKPQEAEKPVPWNVPLDYRGPKSPRARLARKIADLIGAWLEREELLPSQDRPIRPGDIMILVRRRDVFVEEVIRALKERRIPVAGSDRLALTAHIAVMDLMALARFVLLPEDDLALATLLRSPFFGFTEDALFAVAAGRAGPLFAALADHPAHARLEALIDLSQRETPFGFFSRLLGAEGGRRALVSRLGADAEDPIEEFLRVAFDYERLHAPTLQSFLTWLEAGKTEVKRDMDQRRDEVRVMTVHGAKGLESNIVILPDTCTLPHLKSRPEFLPVAGIPLWSARASEDPAPLVAARAAVRIAEEAEHLRLLYVALTRARDRLYIGGYEDGKGRPPESWHALAETAMERLGAAPSEKSVYRVETEQTAPPDGGKQDRPGADAPSALPGWAATKAKPEPPARRSVSPSSLGEDGLAAPPVLSPRTPDAGLVQRFARGRLIHRLLQSLPGLPADRREAAAARFLALPRHGLPRGEQAEMSQAVLRVLGEPGFAAVFAPGSRAEIPVVGEVPLKTGRVPVFGIIDRLAVTAREVLIVDYKTNRPPPASLQAVPPAYLRQMAAYGALLAQVYPGKPLRCALLWTESLTLMPLPPARLAEALQSARPGLP